MKVLPMSSVQSVTHVWSLQMPRRMCSEPGQYTYNPYVQAY